MWLERASEQGHSHAAARLGMIFELGEGVAPDPRRARLHYHRAAEAGHMQAQHRYGMILVSSGDAVWREEGLSWLGSAAAMGDDLSAAALGLMYAKGLHGLLKDACVALRWYDVSERMGTRMPISSSGNRSSPGAIASAE